MSEIYIKSLTFEKISKKISRIGEDFNRSQVVIDNISSNLKVKWQGGSGDTFNDISSKNSKDVKKIGKNVIGLSEEVSSINNSYKNMDNNIANNIRM